MTKIVAYDREHDILVVHKGFASTERFKANIDVGDLILDVSNKGRIRGIEILEASAFFKEFNIPTSLLASLVDADFHAQLKPNLIQLRLHLRTKTVEREIPAKIRVPFDLS